MYMHDYKRIGNWALLCILHVDVCCHRFWALTVLLVSTVSYFWDPVWITKPNGSCGCREKPRHKFHYIYNHIYIYTCIHIYIYSYTYICCQGLMFVVKYMEMGPATWLGQLCAEFWEHFVDCLLWKSPIYTVWLPHFQRSGCLKWIRATVILASRNLWHTGILVFSPGKNWRRRLCTPFKTHSDLLLVLWL
jgi:hypothetical protein